MKISIFLAFLIATCLVIYFCVQISVLLLPSTETEAISTFGTRTFILRPLFGINGGGEAPGPGIPR